MPLLAPVTVVAPPEEPGTPLPPTVPPAAPEVTWTPAGGESRELSTTARFGLMLGGVDAPGSVVGADMPDEAQFEAEFSGDGAIFQGRRSPARQVALPIVVHAGELVEVEQYRRSLLRDFDPRRGVGELMWSLPDGSTRTLFAQYESGLESSEQGRMGGGLYFGSYIVILRARDPYWYGDTRTVTFRPPDEADDRSFLPGPSFQIAGPGPGGTREVTIDGEVDTSPTLHMVGPMLTATWTHEDLGLSLDLTPGLLAGQTLTVRTGPGVSAQERFVRQGVNAWGQVAGDFPPLIPWVLRPGVNSISTQFSGTGAGSDAWLTYRTRYLSA